MKKWSRLDGMRVETMKKSINIRGLQELDRLYFFDTI